MESALLEQAEVAQKLGPLAPKRIETCPEAESAIIIGTRKGLTLSGPFCDRFKICSWRVVSPPTPLPIITPISCPVVVIDRQISLFDGLGAGGYRKLGETVHVAGFFAVDISSGIEAFDLTRKACAVLQRRQKE